MPATSRRKLAVDLDGLLLDTYEWIAAFRFGVDVISITPYVRQFWPSVWLEQVWGGTGEEAGRIVDAFYNQVKLTDWPPIPGAVKCMRELARDFDLVLVTANRRFTDDQLWPWLEFWFPHMFVDIVRTDMFGTKIEALQSIEAVAIVEDRLDYAEHAATAGFPAAVVDRYLWSLGEDTELIRHVPDLESIPAAVRDLLALAA